MKTTAKKLTDLEQEQFCVAFYFNPDIIGDDTESPAPWGMPWFFGKQVSLEGENITEMVDNYIKDNVWDLYNYDLVSEDTCICIRNNNITATIMAQNY